MQEEMNFQEAIQSELWLYEGIRSRGKIKLFWPMVYIPISFVAQSTELAQTRLVIHCFSLSSFVQEEGKDQ